jgi:hypothetical protein
MIKQLAIFTLNILLISVSASYAQTTTEKTFVKSFNLQDKNVVLLDLDGEVEVKSWTNKILRVQMEISLEDGTSSMLKSLVQIGRYNLKSEFGDDFIKILAPAMRKEIRIRGKLLKENIVYTVFAPENVTVIMAEAASTNASNVINVPSFQ